MSKGPDWNETVILRKLNEPDEMMALKEAVRRVMEDGLNTAFISFLDLKGRRDLQLAEIYQLADLPSYPSRRPV